MKKSNGSVLIFTTLFLVLISALTHQLMKNVWVHSAYSSTVIKRERAKALALGGINLALAQLTRHLINKKPTENEKGDQQYLYKRLLKNVLPTLNRWQNFKLDEKIDGIDGEVRIVVSSEDGKLDINRQFDFKTGEFNKLLIPYLEKLIFTSGESKLRKGEVIKKIQKYLKERAMPLDDISQLLEIKGLEQVELFYDPPVKPKGREETQKRKIALADVFTVFTNSDKIEPWFFSDGICSLFDLRRPEWNDAKVREKRFNKAIEDFSKDLGKKWMNNLKVLTTLYDKELDPEIAEILSQQFDPKVYTVISSGKIQDIEAKIMVVLDTTSNSEGGSQDQKSLFRIVKMYWL